VAHRINTTANFDIYFVSGDNDGSQTDFAAETATFRF
jgi:hypothetical protein